MARIPLGLNWRALKNATVVAAVLIAIGATVVPATAQSVTRVYTKFDPKQCQHTRGRGAEDYGSWRCAGHGGIEVRLSAGDQRMRVSFGRDASRELAARQTFPAFNHVHEGTLEWRLEAQPNQQASFLRQHPALER